MEVVIMNKKYLDIMEEVTLFRVEDKEELVNQQLLQQVDLEVEVQLDMVLCLQALIMVEVEVEVGTREVVGVIQGDLTVLQGEEGVMA